MKGLTIVALLFLVSGCALKDEYPNKQPGLGSEYSPTTEKKLTAPSEEIDLREIF